MSWNWEVFCKSTLDEHFSPVCFGTGGEITYLDWMLSAWGWTLSVSALGLIVAMFLGVLMSTLRTLPPDNLLTRSLALVGTVWVELFRNIPVLVQIFLWYHVIPALFPLMKAFPSFVLVSLALGFFTSARMQSRSELVLALCPEVKHMLHWQLV